MAPYLLMFDDAGYFISTVYVAPDIIQQADTVSH